MERILGLWLFFWIGFGLSAQVQLRPSIGLSGLPQDSEPICFIPDVSTGDPLHMDVGPNIGDTVSDFTLFDVNDLPYTLSEILNEGKPVILVSGSYTCHRFRSNISALNSVFSNYYNEMRVLIIHCVEAHPNDVPSPYFGFVNPAAPWYPQPQTYGERKNVLQDMLDSLVIMPDVLIDGPCNEWWSHYGPAENNAYIIDTTGVVLFKHGWLNMIPNVWDLEADIDSLLGTGNGNNTDLNGSFTFDHDGDSVVHGLPGSTLIEESHLINISSQPVAVDVIRDASGTAPEWSTSLCADVCLPPHIDSFRTYIGAGDTLIFSFYFYTDSIERSSLAIVEFTNAADPLETFEVEFGAVTEGSVQVPDIWSPRISIFPNPNTGRLRLVGAKQRELIVFDTMGRSVYRDRLGKDTEALDLSFLFPGVYLLHLTDDNEHSVIRLVIN